MRMLSALLLLATGLGMAAPGLYLAGLGGSPYYVIAGLLILVSAWLVWRKRDSGVALYWLVCLGTLVWSLAEVGLDAAQPGLGVREPLADPVLVETIEITRSDIARISSVRK